MSNEKKKALSEEALENVTGGTTGTNGNTRIHSTSGNPNYNVKDDSQKEPW